MIVAFLAVSALAIEAVTVYVPFAPLSCEKVIQFSLDTIVQL